MRLEGWDYTGLKPYWISVDSSGGLTVSTCALPSGAATETTLAAMSAKLPTSLGQKTAAASISIVTASDDPNLGPATPVPMTALASNLAIRITTGKVRSVRGVLDSTAPTAVYYVQLVQATAAHALPADGAVTHLCTPIPINHTSGLDDPWEFNEIPTTGGIQVTDGCFVVLSSTLVAKTIGGAYLLASGMVA